MKKQHLLLVLALFVPFLVWACSADSPSAPTPTPGTPPGTGGVGVVYNISIVATPGTIPAGSTTPVSVAVTVRRADNGQAPPNNTTVVLSASAGNFTATGSATAVASLFNGGATLSYAPPSAEGTVVLQARLEGSVAQTNVAIAPPATFFLAAVSPNTGRPEGGDNVDITGGGFEQPVRVIIGDAPAQVVSVSPSRIRVRTPAMNGSLAVGETRTVGVTVTVHVNEPEQATDALGNAFIYSRDDGGGGVIQPLVFSMNPASGPNEGGTRVTINGEGFAAPVQVFFGLAGPGGTFDGIEAVVESISANRIVAITPSATGFGQSNLNGLVDVMIKNVATGRATTFSAGFKYGSRVLITAIGPSTGPYTGGTQVEVLGQGFDEPVAVSLGGIGQSIRSVSGTQVVFITSGVVVNECPQSGVVEASGLSVTNIESGDSASSDLSFFYNVPRPLITGVTPGSGSQSGGTSVTLSGAGFEPPMRVSLVKGGAAFTASVLSQSTSSVVVRVPAIPNSALDTEACDDDGDGTQGEKYLPTSFDVRAINLGTTCEDTFAGSFIYNPTDRTCRGDAAPAPADSGGGAGAGAGT